MLNLLLLACTGSSVDLDSSPPAETGEPSDTSSVEVEDPPEEVELDGMCPLETRRGAFAVEAYDSYSAVYGDVSNGVVPNTILTETAVHDTCRLMRTENPYCEPACSAGETCDFDGECIAYPETQDLGVVSVGGLAEDVVMEPVSPGYSYFDTTVPHPVFVAGQTVELSTSGGEVDSFQLHGIGFEMLELSTNAWTVTEGSPVPVSWTVGSADVPTEVFIELNIDQHGASPLTVWCTFEDTGSAEIPAAVVDALIEAGVTGYPSGRVTRRTTDSVDIGDGCVDLVVASPLSTSVDVSGYTPCTSNDDCPPGQTCNLALQVCE